MASVVKIKRSSVTGKSPNTSNITSGELALNITDGKLFSSNGSAIFEVGANLHSLSVGTGGLTIANGAMTFPTSDGSSGQYLKTNGSGVLSWGTVTAGGGESAQISGYSFTANTDQVSFGGTDDFGSTLSYTEGSIQVFLNGIKLVANTDFLASNGTSVFLSSGTANGDVLDIQSYDKISNFVDINASLTSNTKSSNSASEVVVDTWGYQQFRSMKYMVQISNDDNVAQHQVSEVLLVHNGSATFTTEYGQVTTGSSTFATIDSDLVSNQIRLKVTPTVTNSTIKVTRLGITV
jgi:hypothetical protein